MLAKLNLENFFVPIQGMIPGRNFVLYGSCNNYCDLIGLTERGVLINACKFTHYAHPDLINPLKTARKLYIGMWLHMDFLYLWQLDCWPNGCNDWRITIPGSNTVAITVLKLHGMCDWKQKFVHCTKLPLFSNPATYVPCARRMQKSCTWYMAIDHSQRYVSCMYVWMQWLSNIWCLCSQYEGQLNTMHAQGLPLCQVHLNQDGHICYTEVVLFLLTAHWLHVVHVHVHV